MFTLLSIALDLLIIATISICWVVFNVLKAIMFAFIDTFVLLPKYLYHVFRTQRKPFQTIKIAFHNNLKHIAITFLILLPFMTKALVNVTDIKTIETPYNKIETFLNEYDNKACWYFEKKYGLHTKRVKFMKKYPVMDCIITLPVSSNRYYRRIKRHAQYVKEQKRLLAETKTSNQNK